MDGYKVETRKGNARSVRMFAGPLAERDAIQHAKSSRRAARVYLGARLVYRAGGRA